ncbi:hypothetical protein Q4610_17670 [Sphingobium sp. HBC34]|jgi:hypothetical protein|uniref:DUF2846 domain-containing protein n=1 Tax=Sphingobium cyanobacteriorum TaxID=3063954 RepID=A0ABT8ZQQ3_9SPHN|nr:hypothetical protein [Sphingobium sp. HBC34]MDO7836878.1 hypothetical protein [Sphingobium sp. HBC34]
MGLDDRDYMRDRYRRRQGLPPIGRSPRSASASKAVSELGSGLVRFLLIGGLAVLTPLVLVKVYTGALTAQFQSMIPVPFPKSGSVYVTKAVDLQRRQGLLRLKADGFSSNGYFILFHEIEAGKDVLGFYLRGGDNIAVPMPVGEYRVRIASGNTGFWRGIEHLFGSTNARELLALIRVTTATDRAVDLEGSPGRAIELKHNSNAGFFE